MLKVNSWVSLPEHDNYTVAFDNHTNSTKSYDISTDCDIQCSKECMSLVEYGLTLDIIDSCNVNRCNCYLSQVSSNLCTTDCKKSCILVEGGVEEVQECLENSCRCKSIGEDLFENWNYKSQIKTNDDNDKYYSHRKQWKDYDREEDDDDDDNYRRRKYSNKYNDDDDDDEDDHDRDYDDNDDEHDDEDRYVKEIDDNEDEESTRNYTQKYYKNKKYNNKEYKKYNKKDR